MPRVRATPRLTLASPEPLGARTPTIQWSKCIFCQKTGQLTCPDKNPIQIRRHAGYVTMAAALASLEPYHYELPCGLPISAIGGPGEEFILGKLKEHSASWHNKCYLNHTGNALTRLIKTLSSQAEQAEDPHPPGPAADAAAALPTPPRRMKTRSTQRIVAAKEELCFLCGNPALIGKPLHNCSTDMGQVKRSAILLNDTALIAYLATGNDDLVALEAKYHKLCLARLYNRARAANNEGEKERNLITCEGLAFADLLLYMKEKLAQLGNKCVFYVSHLRLAYRDRIAKLLGVHEETIALEHTSRLRQKILAHFPELHEQQSPHGYMLLPSNAAMFNTLDREDQDDDALAVNRFIKKVRQMALATTVTFNGSFPDGCEEASVPPLVLALMNMLMYGSAVHVECRATRPTLTLSQLVMLGIHKATPTGSIVRHKKNLEPPLPLYMGLNIFGTSRDKSTISRLHDVGLSVSSNRVMEVTSELAHLAIERAREEGVVVPEQMRKGLFTIAAVDNIDYKPTAVTSSGEFHGTGITLFQLPLKGQSSTPRKFKTEYADVAGKGNRSVPDLPDFYSVVPECNVSVKKPNPPQVLSTLHMTSNLVFSNIWQKEKPWLNQIERYISERESIVEKENLCDLDASWSAFHASNQGECIHEKSLNELLPLFYEKSNSVAMMKHAMDIIRAGTSYLNDNQVPVLCADQPLFALMKSIQWAMPHMYGEKKFVTMLGPLHLEQAFLKVVGKLLEGCGWTALLGNCGITTVGEAEGLLKVVDIIKSRAIHQLTAAVLHSLLLDAYAENGDGEMTIEEWITERSAADPTFYFWMLVFNLEVLLLSFVKSIRSGDFELYKESMKSMVPWFFLFKHPHYARWLSVHIHDMDMLESFAGPVYRQFQLGNFCVYKTLNPFSALGADHAHEQNNRDVKGKGGAVGLTQNPAAMRRFTIGGPPLTRLLEEFESNSGEKAKTTGLHHEQYRSFQEKFVAKCTALKVAFVEMENPFLTHHSDLIALDTSASAGQEAVKALYAAEENAKAMYLEFCERLGSVTFYTSIPQSKFNLFAPRAAGKVSEVSVLKADCQLFQRLFIVALARDLRMEIFFSFENQLIPASFSQNGRQRQGVKTHLTDILENLVTTVLQILKCQGIIVDGGALIHNIMPRHGAETFENYFSQQLRPFLDKLVEKFHARRLDVVWDTYNSDSIKAATRDSRGKGVRRYNLPLKGKLPPNFDDYLKNSDNKSELFPFLGHLLMVEFTKCPVVTNLGDTIRASANNVSRLDGICIGNLEEADGRIILHATDMVEMGMTSLLVVSSDTDVVVLCVSFFHRLQQRGLKEIFIQYGPSSKFRHIPAHAIANALGRERAEALIGFHAYTGCDTVEFFAGKGKRTAYKAWKEEDNACFKTLASPSSTTQMIMETMGQCEIFTVHMYGLSDVEIVNLARQVLFTSHDKPVTLIPPTSVVLEQHALRAAYQAGQIWGRADTAVSIPVPAGWGWKLEEGNKVWEPLWNTQTDVWGDLAEMGTCGCTTGCGTRRCKCRRIPMPCTQSCKNCRGNCENRSRRTLEPIMEVLEESQEDPDDVPPLQQHSTDE